MITENDLLEAIAECQGQRNPNATTCIKLAAYYTILDNLRGSSDLGKGAQDNAVPSSYSYAPAPSPTIEYDSGTEFSDLIRGRGYQDVLPIIDELVSSVQVLLPRLYGGLVRKLKE